MTDTTTRSLPTDRGQLRSYLPIEPDDTAVSRCRAGIRRLDQLVATAAAQLDEHDRRARAAAVTLADAAIDGDDLEPLVATLGNGKRHALVARVDALRQARAICASRQQTQHTTDPDYVAWTDDCRQVTAEWEQIMSTDNDDDERFAALLAFVERHNPR
jgi:uncharacterized damage-inducible protein DinB